VPRTCVSCARPLPPSALYFRFAIAVEGELDVLETDDPGGSDPREILARMERESDPATAEDEVHWEASGVLCGGCRRRVMEMLGAAARAH
jgi:hypothetical protein